MSITDSKPTSDNPQTKAPQNIQYAVPNQQQFEDDTIDLYELWITLWDKKLLVIAVTAIAALGSVVYALLQPPIYKAETLLLPPTVQDLKSLNFPGVVVGRLGEPEKSGSLKGLYGISVNAVFDSFKNNLSSRRIQKKFFDEHGLIDILAPNRTQETRDIELLESFSSMLIFEDKKVFSVSMESGDPEFAAKLINDYVSFFDWETVITLVSAAQNSIKSQIRDIEYTIGSKRQMAKQRREDTIRRFEEASSIAAILGVRERVDTTNVVQNNQLNISTSTTPLYYRGYQALNAEMDTLKSRKSDDPFISGLRDLQENLALLRSIKIEAEGMHSVTIDKAAYPPKTRIKPNRRLIVSLGTVVGLSLGIFIVFFVSFVQKQKRAHSE